MPNLESLTVIIGEQPVESVTAVERHLRKVFGLFVAGPEFRPNHPVFKVAFELARQFDAAPTEPCDYASRDRLMGAYVKIKNLGPTYSEVASLIEKFAVQANWSGEVTFEGSLA